MALSHFQRDWPLHRYHRWARFGMRMVAPPVRHGLLFSLLRRQCALCSGGMLRNLSTTSDQLYSSLHIEPPDLWLATATTSYIDGTAVDMQFRESCTVGCEVGRPN